MASAVTKSKVKVEELCRTCLSKESVLYSIFDVYSGTITIDYIVTSITGLKIHKNDGFPSTICCNCKEKAANAFDFKTKSEEAHFSLQGILANNKKEWSIPINTMDTMRVKTEDMSLHESDDYTENDFNLSFTSASDLNELEAVKREVEVQNTKPFHECNNSLDALTTQNECLLQKNKKCIKIEYEDSKCAPCPVCGTFYGGPDNLTKHMWTTHADLMGPRRRGRPKKILNTAILGKLTESRLYIKPVTKIECSLCRQYFKTKEDLGTHLITHKDMKVLCCVLCQKRYLERTNYEQHSCIGEKDLSNADSNEKEQLSFLSEITLEEFLSSNTEMENIGLLHICASCNCIFLLEKDLINHYDAEHPDLSQRCNLCTKVFATLRSAARHRTICKQIERKYKCTICDLKFAYEITLNKHILRYHEGESVSVKFIDTKTRREDRQFQCDTCNRCFYKRELLVKHTKIHMPNEKYFECDVCQKKFHRRDNLRSHKRVHEVERDKGSSNTLLCLYCGRSFSNSSNLIVHMRRHTGEKPYKCDFCEKGFPRSSDLQCHRRTHTGEKPCICRVCGKGFSRSNKLSRHMRVHTGQRPYKCSYCDKAFSQSNDLTLHIRRHTGDRPYICEVCGDRFIQGTALQNHRRAHGHFPQPPTNSVGVQSLTYTV